MIHTIGHSTRSIDELLGLLKVHGVNRLADVRLIPRSRRHPHFSSEALAASLADAGIAYRHFPALGGMRKPRPDSTNTAWRHASFRGYADYMDTAAFQQALRDVRAWSDESPEAHVAVMCAEAVWWRCHRQLIADALVAAGIDVRHIMSASAPAPHALTSFARVVEGRVTYPGLV